MRRIGAEGGTRSPTSYLTRPSNVRVCQFRHFGSNYQITMVPQTLRGPQPRSLDVARDILRSDSTSAAYFGEPAGDAACEAAGGVNGDATGATLAAGDACGVGVASGAFDCKTE